MSSARSSKNSNWLLDGSIYFFRGYFGMPDALVDDAGESCGGVHGFAAALVDVLAQHPGQSGAVALDESLGTCFRNELYADYKANRAPPDDNIIYQFQQCARLCDLLGVACYSSTRFEADDLLATLARRCRNKVKIYTLDKDLRQLVNLNCEILDIKTGSGFDAASFADSYGFAAPLFPDYQALVGDTSDNVPGVPGFGPKTAAKLISRYGTLEAVIESIDLWSDDKVGVPSQGKLADNLTEYADQALRMRAVLRLSTQAPLPKGAMRRLAVQNQPLGEFVAAKKLRRVGAVLKQIGLLVAQ